MSGWNKGILLVSSHVVDPVPLICLGLCERVVCVSSCLTHTCHTPHNHRVFSPLVFLTYLGNVRGFVRFLLLRLICEYHIVSVTDAGGGGAAPVERFELRHQRTFLYNHRHVSWNAGARFGPSVLYSGCCLAAETCTRLVCAVIVVVVRFLVWIRGRFDRQFMSGKGSVTAEVSVGCVIWLRLSLWRCLAVPDEVMIGCPRLSSSPRHVNFAVRCHFQERTQFTLGSNRRQAGRGVPGTP